MITRPSLAWISAGFVIAWTSGFIGAELGTRTASADTLLAWRFGLVGVAAAAWLVWRIRRLPARDVAVHAVIGALAQVGYVYGVVHAAELGVAAGTNALIAALQPIMAAAVAAVVLSEPIGRRQVTALIIGLAGTALVVSGDYGAAAGTPLWAFALPLAATAVLVAGTVIERGVYRHRRGPALPDALAVQGVVSGVLCTALAGAGGSLSPPASGQFWIAVAWVIVLSTIGAYGGYWMVAARAGVARVSALLYLTPPVAMLWAWAMFGQTVGAVSAVGIAICGAAVALFFSRPRAKPAVACPGDPLAASIARP